MTLKSLQVIITRPKEQAELLAAYIQSLQGKAIVLPMIDIVPVTIDKTVTTAINTADFVIITSQNAVWHAPLFLIDSLNTHNAKIITIGPSTSKALEKKGISVYFTAPKGSQSETLLDLRELQSEVILNKSIVLLVGIGGRDLIAQTLKARGATVTQIEVYKQVPVHYDLDLSLQEWQKSDRPSCFIITSVNILDNLITQIPEKYMPWVLSQPIIVVSERLAQCSRKYGFQQIINAKSADFQSLITAMDSIKKV